jgi:hypothetical protein
LRPIDAKAASSALETLTPAPMLVLSKRPEGSARPVTTTTDPPICTSRLKLSASVRKTFSRFSLVAPCVMVTV